MLENLTIKEAKELIAMFNSPIISQDKSATLPEIDKYWIGKKVIVRTYSAGVHFGEIFLKSNNEIILKNARRLYYWETLNKGLSLSEVANDGLNNNSKVCQSVSKIYLKAIELIECTESSVKNIEAINDYKAI